MSETAQPPQLIRHGALENDGWRLYTQTEAGLPPDEPGWIIALTIWLTAHAALRARRHPVAILLAPDSELKTLADEHGRIDTTGIAFIAIDFPVYTDGRGYSLAQLLRSQYGYAGELRAVGDIMIDTVHYQARVGFDSFLVKPGHDPQQALAALKTFSVHYQQTYRAPR